MSRKGTQAQSQYGNTSTSQTANPQVTLIPAFKEKVAKKAYV